MILNQSSVWERRAPTMDRPVETREGGRIDWRMREFIPDIILEYLLRDAVELHFYITCRG